MMTSAHTLLSLVVRNEVTYCEGGCLLFLLSLWFFNDSLQIPAEDGTKEGGCGVVGFALINSNITSVAGLSNQPVFVA